MQGPKIQGSHLEFQESQGCRVQTFKGSILFHFQSLPFVHIQNHNIPANMFDSIYFVLFTLEPIKLAIGKEYNLNNLKEIQVTEDFLSLDKSVIGCQNEGSIDECKTREYIDALMSQCKCLPFSIRLSEEEVIN